MKKIFAIALALVMVFSMASAFALNDCFSGFDWSCATKVTNCGKAKVEVVPYVKVNNGCGWFDWQVNDCATAIVSENVYFAVRLTIDANVDKAWLDAADVTLDLGDGLFGTATGFNADFNVDGEFDDEAKTSLKDFVPYPENWKLDADEAQVFYLTDVEDDVFTWTHEDDADADDAMWSAVVVDTDDAEVCATIASSNPGWGEWTYGDYTVVASKTDAKGDYGYFQVKNDCGAEVKITWEKGKVTTVYATSDAFRAEVFAKFNLSGCGTGTCIDAKIVQRNFGWDDEFDGCFPWSNKGAAVVNPECVVAIPKTGDVSVVAYAVMAVVAAAGAMLKK